MKYCKNCGQEIGNNKVCANCGHRKKYNKTIRAVVTIICCISIITVGLLGVLRFSNKDTVSNTNRDYVFFTEGFTDVKITDEKSAIEAVASVSNVLGVADAEKELKVKSVNTIGGDKFYRMQQCYNDIPVYGKAITVAADKNGIALSLTSKYKILDEDINLNATVTEEKIKESLQDYFKVDEISFSVDDSNLVLYENNEEEITLAYEINVLSKRVLVDANSSKILFDTDLYQEALVECEYKDGKFMGTKVSDNEYWLGNDEKGIFVLNAEYKKAEKYPDPKISAPMTSTDNYFGNGDKYKSNEYVKAVDMLNYLQSTSEYFENYNKNHDSSIIAIINDAGTPDNAHGGYSHIKDITNATIPYKAEYISGICFGENYCKNLYDYIDTIGHEYTHGVFNRSLYCDTEEAFAINEAYADIFGELIESSIKEDDINWIHGDRNMVNPHVYENAEHPYPASIEELNNAETFSEDGDLWYRTKKNEGSDYSHFASTIISHSAYLMWNGIDGTDERKIEQDKLGELWYRSIMLLQDDTSFSQCRNAVELSARIMLRNKQLTEEQYKTVVTAFDTVGIEEANFTYSSTVKNKFDLSVLSIEGTENVSYKLEVIKSIIKPGPDETERIMEKTSLKGKQSLDLENGIYIIRITDVNDTDNISQTISMRIVVDGNDSDATDEVIVYTDFTDVITVVLDDTSTDETSAVFKSGDSLVYVGDKIIYAKNDGIYYRDNPTSSENKIVSTQKDHASPQNARNLLSDGETVFFTVNPGASADNFGAYYQQDEVYSVKVNGENLSKLFKTEGDVKLVTCYDDYLFYLNNHDSNYGYSSNESDYMLNKYNIETGENVEFSNSDLGISNGDSIGDFVSVGTKIYLEAFSSGDSYDNCDIIEFDTKSSKANNVLQNAHIVSPSTNAQQGVVCFETSGDVETSGDNDWYVYSVNSSGKMTKSEKIPSRLTLSQGVISNDGSFALIRSDINESDFDLYKVYLKTGKIEVIENGAGCFKNKGAGLTYDKKHEENIYVVGPGGSSHKFNGSGYDKVETEGDIASLNYWLIDGCFIATQDYSDFTWNTINEVESGDNNKQTSIDEDWKSLYIDYVNSMNEAYEDIYIAYIDGDNIPELYVIGKYHMAGASLCWIDNGEVKFQVCAQNFGFKERSEKCYAYTMQMGVSMLTEYTLSNGKLTEKEIASCSENNGTYTWNGTDVSKDDFWSKHQDYISNYTTPTYTEYTKREDFTTVIQSY